SGSCSRSLLPEHLPRCGQRAVEHVHARDPLDPEPASPPVCVQSSINCASASGASIPFRKLRFWGNVSRCHHCKQKGSVMTMTVSVYGGGSPKPGDPAYQQAYELGRLLAEAGYTVMTGGYSGTMEATSRGAKEAGGYVIGVTVGLFERAGLSPNPAIGESIQCDQPAE